MGAEGGTGLVGMDVGVVHHTGATIASRSSGGFSAARLGDVPMSRASSRGSPGHAAAAVPPIRPTGEWAVKLEAGKIADLVLDWLDQLPAR